jgi:NADH:ubiquinone oxidoreductase subunit E
MQNRIVIEICLGSSCFSRGSGKTLQSIQKYLKDHKLENDVVLKGNHCFGDCSKGPVIKVGDEVHEQVSNETILDILEETFKQK